jgi:lysophospholipid acyltransferase (LPLAT)-like uncharacterized protein
MQLLTDFAVKLGGLAVVEVVRRLTSTLDASISYYDRTADPAHPDFCGPAIFLFWHEYFTLPFHMRGHCDIAMLLSRHRDAEWLSWPARQMGFETIRGSTYRGAGTALRQMMDKGKSSNLAITPDGPRGPRRKMSQGPIYLSSKLQIPLVPLGIGYDRPWRLKTWDRFAIPRPFSRGRAVTGPSIQIPDDLDRQGLERYRMQMEQLLERLTLEAEAWAASGKRTIGQFPFRREGKPWWSRSRHRQSGVIELSSRPSMTPALEQNMCVVEAPCPHDSPERPPADGHRRCA